jgi:periplasmic divalent cation tolerance protein
VSDARGEPDGRPLVVLVSVPDAATGEELARTLVEAGLAACVTRLPGAVSTYRWQGVLETAAEELLIVKTLASRWPALRDAVRRAHPYDVPEILALPVVDGLDDYLAWMAGSLSGAPAGDGPAPADPAPAAPARPGGVATPTDSDSA